MYRTVLVPLDGSPLGERALPLALLLSRAGGARLVIVRAVEARPGPAGTPSSGLAGQQAEARDYLGGLAIRLAEAGVPVQAATPDAPAADGILGEVERWQADLIVMSSHGRSGLGRWVYGSVAEAILQRSAAPVLLARSASPEERRLTAGSRPRLLVPLDGSANGEAVLPHAAALARLLGGSVLLLRVIAPLLPPSPELALLAPARDQAATIRERADAESYLLRIAARLGRDGASPRIAIRSGPAAEAIVEEARAGASLVLMSSHGRTGLRRLPTGSVTAEVLRRSELPLLVVRPPGLAERLGVSALGLAAR